MSNAHDIDAALSRPRFALALGSGLEAEFDRRQEAAARSQIILVLIAALVLTTLGLLADANAGLLPKAVAWKSCVQVPAVLLGIVVAWRRILPADRLWLAGAMPMTVTVGVVMVLAVEAGSPMTDRYATTAGLTAFAANLALPVKLRDAALMTAANVAVFVGIPLLTTPFAAVAPYLDVLLFLSAVALSTLVVVYNRERTQKRACLLDLAHESQTMELQTLVNELTQLAHRDPLTGAGNRRSFDMRYQAMWRAAMFRREQLALILIDVDHFKLFNDSAGHAAGDTCLKAIAASIAQGAGCPIEAVARYGGEEFALVLQSTTGRQAEAIRSSVAALALPHPGLPAGSIVTVSIGKAFACPGTGKEGPDDLVRAADEALYEAKKAGRNRIVLKGDFQAAA